MRYEIIATPFNDPEKSCKIILDKLKKLEFIPNFILLFLTPGVQKRYTPFVRILRKFYPATPMLGLAVEGYIVKNEIWTRGLAILLGEFEGEVKVYYEREASATELARKIGSKIGRGWDAVLLVFPSVYIPGKINVIKNLYHDKINYIKFMLSKNSEDKKKVLEDHSKHLEKEGVIFPINKVLRIISRKIKSSILGVNLIPLEASFNSPLIIANYEVLKPGIAAMCFKGKVNIAFHDLYPERGKDFLETLSVIESFLCRCEKVKLLKKEISIGLIQNLKPSDFIEQKRKIETSKKVELINQLEKGKFLMFSPYILVLISSTTHGCSFLGLEKLPLNFYPSIFDLDVFYDEAIFCGEVFGGGIKEMIKVFDYKIFDSALDFFVIDCNIMMAYGGKVHSMINLIKRKSGNFFGIFSACPSAYIPEGSVIFKKRYLSEIEKNIFATGSGTITLLELKI